MNPTFFLFGAGYSAKAFARANGGGTTIFGTTRTPGKFDALRESGIDPVLFDGEKFTHDARDRLSGTTHIVVSAAPDESGDPVLNAAVAAIRETPNLQWIGYLSTVGVYGDAGGDWVDENCECRPKSRRSIDRLEAEQDWLALGAAMNVPVAVLRLSGIYGPGRNAFVNLENGTAKRLVKPGQVFNRIHADDIAGALWHLAGKDLGGVFNVTDDLPAPPQDVVAYAAELMRIAPPPEIPFETAQLSPMARSFYGENKRVSNRALKATGYAFRQPDYMAALSSMWRENSWRGENGDRRSSIRAQ